MKFFKVADIHSKAIGSHFKNNENYLETCLKNLEKTWKDPGMLSVQKKWEPCNFVIGKWRELFKKWPLGTVLTVN